MVSLSSGQPRAGSVVPTFSRLVAIVLAFSGASTSSSFSSSSIFATGGLRSFDNYGIVGAKAEAASGKSWLPHFETSDPDCWSKNGLVDWEQYRREFFDSVKEVHNIDAGFVLSETFQRRWLRILERFPEALAECPLGSIASSLLAAAWQQKRWQLVVPLPAYFVQTPGLDLVSRDVVELTRLVNFRVMVTTEWPIFKILCSLNLSDEKPVVDDNNQPQSCDDLSVSGYPAPFILETINTFTTYAENKGLQAAKFLKELDPMIYGMMKDPREFGSVFLSNCPSGALSIATVSCILALMASPSLFEKFERIVQMLFDLQLGVLVQKETMDWKVFCMMHALSTFRLRSYDLAFRFEEMVLEKEPLAAIGGESRGTRGITGGNSNSSAILYSGMLPSWRVVTEGQGYLLPEPRMEERPDLGQGHKAEHAIILSPSTMATTQKSAQGEGKAEVDAGGKVGVEDVRGSVTDTARGFTWVNLVSSSAASSSTAETVAQSRSLQRVDLLATEAEFEAAKTDRAKIIAKVRARAEMGSVVQHDATSDRFLPALVQNQELYAWLADHFFPMAAERTAAPSSILGSWSSTASSDSSENPHIYLSAVGGKMMQPYVPGFIRRFFLELGLKGLILAGLDEEGVAACRQEKARFTTTMNNQAEDPYKTLLCLDSQQGHVIYNKHRWIPVLLSMHIDVLWLDFDIFLLQDPVKHIKSLVPDLEKKGRLDYEVKKARGLPLDYPNMLPTQQVSHHPDEPYGFDTDSVEDLTDAVEVQIRSPDFEKQYSRANVKKIYRDARSAKAYIPLRDPKHDSTSGSATTTSEDLPDIYVTEHYDALCMNSGVFFVRASGRTLRFFLEFLRWQFDHVFADNQNGFDAMFQHSCADSYTPISFASAGVTYGLLDVERSYLCAEGWHGPSVADAILFHFWTSDFDHKNKRRDGSTIRMKKKDYFQLFYGCDQVDETRKGVCLRDEREIVSLLEDLRYPRFKILEKCAVMTTGINDLIEAKTGSAASGSSLKPNHQDFEQRRRKAVEALNRKKKEDAQLVALKNDYGVDYAELQGIIIELQQRVQDLTGTVAIQQQQIGQLQQALR
ncbi:unnamed protein product [Amoebophrya sp. A25]|nr:unnamed protein product [Amoebophrya sp. A25]|eukprot:GSA25T00025671001.1